MELKKRTEVLFSQEAIWKIESKGTSYNIRGFKNNNEKGIFTEKVAIYLNNLPTDMAESTSLEVLKM